MPECAFHPGVETNVRCSDCDRYICPKDMVDTPVGYKCRECGLVGKPKMGGVKPRQIALGIAAGVVAALVLAPLVELIPFFRIFGVIVYGALVGEATRRGGGGHRTPEFAAIAAVAAGLGAGVAGFFSGFDIFLLFGGPIVAAIYVQSWRWFG